MLPWIVPLEPHPAVLAAPLLVPLISLSARPMRIPLVTSSETAAGQIALRNLLYFQKNTNASFLNFCSFLQLQTPGGYSSFSQNGRALLVARAIRERALLGARAMNHPRIEIAPAPSSAAFGSTVIPGCACLPIARAPSGHNSSHWWKPDLRDVLARHAIPAVQYTTAESLRGQRPRCSHDASHRPYWLTNPRTLIHTASFAEEDQ